MTRKTFALVACCLISPAIAAAQTGGLNKVQLLALQQELKDQCGLAHSTGVMDGPTRHAIAVCNKKYNTTGNGAALLAAMNVGFNTGDNEPAGGMSGMTESDHGMSMGRDSAHHRMMKGKMKGKMEGKMEEKTEEHDSAMAGHRDGKVRNPAMGKRTKAGRDSVKH